MTRCPRCEAAIITTSGALSRTTRDAGAPVTVCDRCGQREGLYGRDVEAQIPLSEWPVPIETLLREEEALIRRFRESELVMLRADDIDIITDA